MWILIKDRMFNLNLIVAIDVVDNCDGHLLRLFDNGDEPFNVFFRSPDERNEVFTRIKKLLAAKA